MLHTMRDRADKEHKRATSAAMAGRDPHSERPQNAIFADNRATTTAQRKLADLAEHSPRMAAQRAQISSAAQLARHGESHAGISLPASGRMDAGMRSQTASPSSGGSYHAYSGAASIGYRAASGAALSMQYAPVQMTEKGRTWGNFLGGVAGGIAGASLGALYSSATALAGGVAGGLSGAWKGAQHGGVGAAMLGLVGGGMAGAAAGMYAGGMTGAALGSSVGSFVGGAAGNWMSNMMPGKKEEQEKVNSALAERMRTHLQLLEVEQVRKDLDRKRDAVLDSIDPAAQSAKPRQSGNQTDEKESPENSKSKKWREAMAKMDANEVALLQWMLTALGPLNFAEVIRGGQVRVKYDEAVFAKLIGLGAEKRLSSHYAGVVFASSFRQIPERQYGTKGIYLPTVLFGEITRRDGERYMYFQPEGNAYNPKTPKFEKILHVKDALIYFLVGIQQGPHGQSLRTDADPISDEPKVSPSMSDQFGKERIQDIDMFIRLHLGEKIGIAAVAAGGGLLMLAAQGVGAVYAPSWRAWLTEQGLYVLTQRVWAGYLSTMQTQAELGTPKKND